MKDAARHRYQDKRLEVARHDAKIIAQLILPKSEQEISHLFRSGEWGKGNSISS